MTEETKSATSFGADVFGEEAMTANKIATFVGSVPAMPVVTVIGNLLRLMR